MISKIKSVVVIMLLVLPEVVFGYYGSWWNTSYRYRQQITITTGTVTVSAGYVNKLTLDTSALVNAGKMRSDRKDFRIIYLNGSTWIEIDRDYVATDNIYFKLQANISANSSDNNYYVYYGNSSETTTPASDLSNIYNTQVSGTFTRSASSSIDPDTFTLISSADVARYTSGKYSGRKGIIIEQPKKNWCLDSYLNQQGADGSVLSGSWTGIAGATVSTDRAKYGTKSIKFSCAGTEVTAEQTFSSLTASDWREGGFGASAYVYIPNNFTTGGTGPYIRVTMSSTNIGTGTADLSKRDQWQRINTPTIYVTVNGNPSFTNGVPFTLNVNTDPLAAGFPTSGSILILATEFTYTGTSGNSFTGVTPNATDSVPASAFVLPIPDKVIISSGSNSPNGTIYVDAVQVEDTNSPTTYIPTTTLAVTRNVEDLSYPTSNIINNTTGSISFWMGLGFDANMLFVDQNLFGMTYDTSNRMVIRADRDLIYLGVANGASFSLNNGASISSWTKGSWHHIVLTWTPLATNIMSMYIDGIRYDYSLNMNSMTLPTTFQIGNAYLYYSSNSVFSDFSAFNRVLTNAEVTALYTMTSSPHGTGNAIFFAPLDNSLTGYSRTLVTPEPTIATGTEVMYSLNQKIVNPNERAEITAPDDLQTKMIVEAGTTDKQVEYKIDTITSVPEGNRGYKKPIVSYEFSAKETETNKELKILKKPVKLIIHCTSDGNYVLGTNPLLPLGEANSRLAIGYWNRLYWMPISNSKVTISSNNRDILVEVDTTHFSKYGIIVSSVEEKKKFRAEPNPFTPAASQYNYVTFSFDNENNELAQAKIWDITGRLVMTIEGYSNSLIWDGRDENGEIVEGGVYIYQVKVGQDVVGKGTIVVAL